MYTHTHIRASVFCSVQAMSKPEGPRGGKTTVTKTTIRKTVLLHHDEEAALREAAFRERLSESEIIRRALRAYLEIED